MCQLRLSFLLTLLQISLGWGQNLPYIACPELFEYLGYNQEHIGHINLKLDSSIVENTLRVELSQPGRHTSSYPGDLNLLENEESVRYRLRNNEPINYRVDFPTPGVVPKLTMISLNGQIVCRSMAYGPPSTKLSLSHTLRSTGPLLNLLPQQPQQIPKQPQFSQQPQYPQYPQQPEEPVRARPQPQPQPQQQQEPFRPRPGPTPAPQFIPEPLTTTTQRPTAPSSARQRPSGNRPRTLGQLNGVCGREKPVSTPLIHFGQVVERGQLPWMVALYERVGNEYNFLCGGTLISASTVLSAAHCFRFGSRNLPSTRTAVSLGRNSLDLLTPGALRAVAELVIHEQYNPSIYTDADLAMLKLAEPVDFSDYIRPICLWNENYLLDLPSGHKSYVAGWGEDERGNRNSRIAKMTDTDIITLPECRGNLTSENVRFVTSRTVCASNREGAGPCNGDSGGGLMLQESDIWLLRGVVSAGQRLSNRCDLSQPVIYTDLARHIEWLHTVIWY
ncbi:putative serine protease 42 [Drosophila guanche]|uniref:Blast:Enteropeptidase n=1 Tax=Drosophila guanche TaxID=7266 RepID=A0A3B0KVQ1_DROGU|nr:putative serine protease 42 [Drosophila guanche]SPP88078.1 blast:Enteropeptidase [Drosophila guanche]